VALNTYPGFAVDAAVGTSFGTASTRVALPGTPASDGLTRVCNLGPNPVSVKLGSSAVAALLSDTVVMPGQELFLATGTADHIAGIQHGGLGMGSTVNIATGN
jgi:hypothetical protein